MLHEGGLWHALLAEPREPWCLDHPGRAVPSAEAVRRLRAVAPKAGITRLADLTGLDRLGIPVYQAVRPGSRNISVSMGKGVHPDDARASALMEAIETFCAEAPAGPCRLASTLEMEAELDYDPDLLLRHDPRRAGRRARVAWIAATHLADGRTTWVPRALVALDFTVAGGVCVDPFAASSNGLAGGNTAGEAVVHALCELIERDAACRALDAWRDPEQRVARSSLPPAEADLTARFAAGGVDVVIVRLPSPTGVPCFAAYAGEGSTITVGMGAALDPAVALRRAITEAAQARLALIAGARDDLHPEDYASSLTGDSPSAMFVTPCRLDFAAIEPRACSSTPEALAALVDAIVGATGTAPRVVDLARPDLGVPVVFAVAPGLRYRPKDHGRGALTIGPPARPTARAGRRLRIYVGPSLAPDAVARAILGAAGTVEVVPPIRRGDLLALLDDPPRVVAIIDGVFGQVPSVLHKEIAALAARGCSIVGGGSMGALRASEVGRPWIEGVGEVHAMLCHGVIDADDEVAVLHGTKEIGFRPGTVALVDVRDRLAAAVSAGALDAASASAFLDAARELHFSERTARAIAGAAAGVGAEARVALAPWLAAPVVGVKARDAEAVIAAALRRLARASAAPPAPPPPQTRYLARHAHEHADALALGAFKLLARDAAAQTDRAWRTFLLRDEAAARGIEGVDDRALARRLRRELGDPCALTRSVAARHGVAARSLAPSGLAPLSRLAFEATLVRLLARGRRLSPYRRWVADVLAAARELVERRPDVIDRARTLPAEALAARWWRVPRARVRREAAARAFTASWELERAVGLRWLGQVAAVIGCGHGRRADG